MFTPYDWSGARLAKTRYEPCLQRLWPWSQATREADLHLHAAFPPLRLKAVQHPVRSGIKKTKRHGQLLPGASAVDGTRDPRSGGQPGRGRGNGTVSSAILLCWGAPPLDGIVQMLYYLVKHLDYQNLERI